MNYFPGCAGLCSREGTWNCDMIEESIKINLIKRELYTDKKLVMSLKQYLLCMHTTRAL